MMRCDVIVLTGANSMCRCLDIPVIVRVNWRELSERTVERGDCFGHMDFEHQVNAAAQIQAKVDSIADRLLKATVRDADEAVAEDQQDRYDECRFAGQILSHDSCRNRRPMG